MGFLLLLRFTLALETLLARFSTAALRLSLAGFTTSLFLLVVGLVGLVLGLLIGFLSGSKGLFTYLLARLFVFALSLRSILTGLFLSVFDTSLCLSLLASFVFELLFAFLLHLHLSNS